MSRSTFRGWVLLLPVTAVAASCQLFPKKEPPVSVSQPAAEPSAEELERRRRSEELLAEITARLARLEKTGTEEPDPEPLGPIPGMPRRRPATRTAASGGNTGTNSTAVLTHNGTTPRFQPTAPAPVRPEEVTLKTLVAALEERGRADPRNVKLQRQLRVLYLLDGQDEKALEVIDGASPTEQAFWRQVMWALVNYTDDTHGLSESERAGEAIRALDDARRILMKNAPLEIKNLTFCTAIQGFGSITPVENAEFKPNQLVLLYCELDGFTNEAAEGNGQYRAVVQQELELMTPRGDTVWTLDSGPTEDLCRSPRRDFYFFNRFNLPERALPGQYVLKVRMTDAQAGKTAEETVTIRIQ